MVASAVEAVQTTHEWFERNSGWAPPDDDTLAEWMSDGLCRCPDDCVVAPSDTCPHGLASWWLVLQTLDRPDAVAPLTPLRLTPHPDRLDPGLGEFVAIMDAHHRALLAGDPGYMDPVSGLFVLTARSLWDRGSCCEQGCRHCPYIDR